MQGIFIDKNFRQSCKKRSALFVRKIISSFKYYITV